MLQVFLTSGRRIADNHRWTGPDAPFMLRKGDLTMLLYGEDQTPKPTYEQNLEYFQTIGAFNSSGAPEMSVKYMDIPNAGEVAVRMNGTMEQRTKSAIRAVRNHVSILHPRFCPMKCKKQHHPAIVVKDFKLWKDPEHTEPADENTTKLYATGVTVFPFAEVEKDTHPAIIVSKLDGIGIAFKFQ